jgi:hypothetical protein
MNRKPKRPLFEVSGKVPISQESEATAAFSKALGVTSTEEQEQETKSKMVWTIFRATILPSRNWSIGKRMADVRTGARKAYQGDNISCLEATTQ